VTRSSFARAATPAHRARLRAAGAAATAFALAALAARAEAQPQVQALAPKRTLTVGAAPGCVGAAATRAAVVRRDNSEARRLAAQGQEAALVGDRAAARDAFARAAALNPTDDRIAYDLGRAHEELADTSAAVGEYCRYLVLSPEGREVADVRARLVRLVPRGAAQSAEQLLEAFRLGVSQYERARFDAAITAFDDVVGRAPSAAEAYFNRALARAAAGRRADALRDFETYLATAAAAEDRAAVTRAIDALRRPVYSESAALTRGLLLPGLGQFYTGRPGRGTLVFGGVAGAVFMALRQRTTTREIPYVDPNGFPVPYDTSYVERPYAVAGGAAAVALLVVGAFEASRYARASERRASGVQGPPGAPTPRSSGLGLSPVFTGRSGLGVRLTTRF
jgi:tetratricopeptide (TPR) repeat protein